MHPAKTTFNPGVNPRISKYPWDPSPGSQTPVLWNFSLYSSLKSLFLFHHSPSLSVIFWLYFPPGHFPQELSHQHSQCLGVLPDLPKACPAQERSNQLLSLPRYQLWMEIFSLAPSQSFWLQNFSGLLELATPLPTLFSDDFTSSSQRKQKLPLKVTPEIISWSDFHWSFPSALLKVALSCFFQERSSPFLPLHGFNESWIHQ